MPDFVDKALYIFSENSTNFVDAVVHNSYGVAITPVSLAEFLENHETWFEDMDHVIISGDLTTIKKIFRLAMQYGFSVGLIPTPDQKKITKVYGLPDTLEENIEIALRKDAHPIDIILCNEKILLFKATLGQLPLLDSSQDVGSVKFILEAMKRLLRLYFHPFTLTINEKLKIDTAGSGCMILQRHENTLASKLIAHDSSINDGMISLIVSAPLSIVDYFKFIYHLVKRANKPKNIPTTGYIKSPEIDITTEEILPVLIDEKEETKTPLHCKTIPNAIRLNIGEQLRKQQGKLAPAKEKIDIDALPKGKELAKTKGRRIPFFPFATEESFKALFISLRNDAKINYIYLILIVLSTMLAAVGLYQSNSAVVIGAMLLAPLMAPIVSLSMGLLRQDAKMSQESIMKIAVGTVLALLSAAAIALMFPYKPITPEIQARLHPTLFDLVIALISGVAGAYAKSHKEIIESLAGVAIAVALIPPLAVAGIGIGIWNFTFFSQAFLLFLTNLVGIILAAAFTFRLLGYSSVIANKKAFSFVIVATIIIAVPLYISTNKIVSTYTLEKRWKQERFLVHDKYLIIQNAHIIYQRHHKLLYAKILTREPLDRNDLNLLREKIQSNFGNNLKIRLEMIFIP